MATYTGINHLAMATGDMDVTIRFWRDLLGMRLVAEPTPLADRVVYPGEGKVFED